ncbi:MAG: phosphoglycerate dehydrogenase [Kordiimonadaceae bacterium]|jgi:D-3-phosphoglycerate dehydrogenase / 2-oxoglutarate reductase|nr:phosphoglycerate dehydrogenase [Kordiimonadaceae bacterium]
MVKVLISDKLSPLAKEIFERRGIEVDQIVGLTKEELEAIIHKYDGLAIRSATKVTPKILAAATNLKAVGRAGIGVDNVDIPAATGNGVVVMNTPFGNSITTAEHAIAMMFAVARQIPEASASTHAGKWEKSRFMGVELTSKTLGIIGCGNIGAIAASRAIGLKMKVIAFDPFLSEERAEEIGVEKVELDSLLARADFISLHTPLTDSTRGILGAEAFAKMKDGVRIVNCARGGLIDEAALKVALDNGKVAGVALDVFEVEPAKENALFGYENVVVTPHLGASTSEAQVNVAVQVAEQMSDYLLDGAVTNALNMPSLTAEESKRLSPYMALVKQLGSFIGQLNEDVMKEIKIDYQGDVTELNVRPLTSIVVEGLLSPLMTSVNMVNALSVAKDRNINVIESKHDGEGDYLTLVKVTVVTDKGEFSTQGTLFADRRPRIVQVDDIRLEGELAENMIFATNDDQPGFIGSLGTILGEGGLNIATFSLGRHDEGGRAVALVAVDQPASGDVIAEIKKLSQVRRVKSLSF